MTVTKIALPCPFDGLEPNVFEVDYGEGKERHWMPERRCWSSGWVVECKSMGCIFKRSNPHATIYELLDDWNKRGQDIP